MRRGREHQARAQQKCREPVLQPQQVRRRELLRPERRLALLPPGRELQELLVRGLVREPPGRPARPRAVPRRGMRVPARAAVPRPVGRYGFRECGDGSGCFRLGRGCGAVWSGAEHGRIFDVVVAVCCGDRERLPALRAESCGAGQRGAAVRTYHDKPLSWFALPSLLYSRHVIFSSLFAVFGRGI